MAEPGQPDQDQPGLDHLDLDRSGLDQLGLDQSGPAVPVLAVVGRPNVGKSTMVNRILGSRQAVVEDTPGVTRDRVTYDATWRGRAFTLVDTGGWEPEAEGGRSMAARVAAQARVAVEAADAVLFVVDAVVGVTDADDAVAAVLRRSRKPVVLAANKIDDAPGESNASSLWSLGLGEPYSVSALHGRGSGDLLDAMLDALPEAPGEKFDQEGGPRRVALIGRPNVGKSSLLNKLAGHERVLVDSVAGTTRDPVDELIELGGKTWRFVDTAGIRRRMRETQGADYFAALRTESALERAEVAVVLIDASEPLAEQDLRIVSMVIEAGRALVIAYNKWDTVDEDRQHFLDREIDRQLHTARWAPRVNISAKTGWHVDRLVPALETALASWETRVQTGRLNAWLSALIAGDAAASARRQAAQGHVRHPGRDQAAALRAVHVGLPAGGLPAVHRAPAARGVRLRRHPGARHHAAAREAVGRRRPRPVPALLANTPRTPCTPRKSRPAAQVAAGRGPGDRHRSRPPGTWIPARLATGVARRGAGGARAPAGRLAAPGASGLAGAGEPEPDGRAGGARAQVPPLLGQGLHQHQPVPVGREGVGLHHRRARVRAVVGDLDPHAGRVLQDDQAHHAAGASVTGCAGPRW